MDIDAVRGALEHADLASLALGVAIGFLFAFNPVALAATPVAVAYVAQAHTPRRAALLGSAFVLAMLATHALLGFVVALGGSGIQRIVGRQWGLVLGPLLIVLGLAWSGALRLPLPRIPLRARHTVGTWGAAALGASFTVAVCPMCAPALVVLLGVAAGVGSPLFGALLLVAFGVGRLVPVVVGASALGGFARRVRLHRSRRVVDIAGGVVLVLAGLYLLNAYFFVVRALAV